MGPEAKLYQKLRKNSTGISWIRLENLSSLGTPDLLGYNIHQHFFTVELKVANGNKVRLSPHQISFHIRHPKNTFILVKTKAACRLYLGKQVKELLACGCSLAPVACGWTDTRLWLEDLGNNHTLAYP